MINFFDRIHSIHKKNPNTDWSLGLLSARRRLPLPLNQTNGREALFFKLEDERYHLNSESRFPWVSLKLA